MACELPFASQPFHSLVDSAPDYRNWKALSHGPTNSQIGHVHRGSPVIMHSPIMFPIDAHGRRERPSQWSSGYADPRPIFARPEFPAPYSPSWTWNGVPPPPTRTASTSSSLEDGVRPPPAAVATGRLIESSYPSPGLRQAQELSRAHCEPGFHHHQHDHHIPHPGSQHGSPVDASPPWDGNPLQQIQALPDSYADEYPSPMEPMGGGGGGGGGVAGDCPQPYSYPSPVSVHRGTNEEYPPPEYIVPTQSSYEHPSGGTTAATQGPKALSERRASHPAAASSVPTTAKAAAAPAGRGAKARRKSAPAMPASKIRKRAPARRSDAVASRPANLAPRGTKGSIGGGGSGSGDGSGKVRCPHCSTTTAGRAALQRHVAAAHTRPFVCALSIYGCPATFGAKNEWKRHVVSQHLDLGVWRCDMGRCRPEKATATAGAPKGSKGPQGKKNKGAAAPAANATTNDCDDNDNEDNDDDVEEEGEDEDEEEAEVVYNEFNRKDLFTQHVRRMHGPAKTAPAAQHHAFRPAVAAAAQRCYRARRDLPAAASCGYCAADPARPNPVAFSGAGAWEARMEHVGRHLEASRDAVAAAAGVDEPQGAASATTAVAAAPGLGPWQEDLHLRDWLLAEGLLEGSPEEGWSLVGA